MNIHLAIIEGLKEELQKLLPIYSLALCYERLEITSPTRGYLGLIVATTEFLYVGIYPECRFEYADPQLIEKLADKIVHAYTV